MQSSYLELGTHVHYSTIGGNNGVDLILCNSIDPNRKDFVALVGQHVPSGKSLIRGS